MAYQVQRGIGPRRIGIWCITGASREPSYSSSRNHAATLRCHRRGDAVGRRQSCLPVSRLVRHWSSGQTAPPPGRLGLGVAHTRSPALAKFAGFGLPTTSAAPDQPLRGAISASRLWLRSARAAFAQATIDHNTNSKSNGSTIGQQSSAATGNGDVVSGNGTGTGFFSGDQTTAPGSRADAVHDAKTKAGENSRPGRNNK